MINAIIKGIFGLITALFSAIMNPIISVITSLFPSTATFFTSISTFLSYCFTYVRSILALLCIPDTLIVALFDYFIILYTIYTTVVVVKFAINIYNKLKIQVVLCFG